ncbi:tRNA pseudouridine(38-40) synthase TruA [Corynebacterium aquatimens]|uniref:tRNA pseudouridine synthase A n=1 Tax=Corynebacterium aquatimens TaxID=1190508 RepID=A0A931DZM6_9CORY|nr:tRNA pseudouridine(38-40) synthase TruA [Corynebacterium aquatimens]MBG6123035.1 tRNA pseudouridine38-40 synthase [Corynebacterium aquatimens]
MNDEPAARMRLRLDIAYDGTDFHGWARQAAGDDGVAVRTVQQTIEEALQLVLRVPVVLTVAGRTDAGVHASGQVAHVDVPRESLDQRSIDGDPNRLVRRLAKLLPDDVSVRDVTEVTPDFDARFAALTRTYRYRVTTAPAGPVPTRARDTATWAKPVDIDRVQEAATLLLGLHDFAAFCKPKPHATTVRDLHEFTWRDVSTPQEPELFEATLTADAFCWNHVRAMVAACLDVGEGRRDAEWIDGLLAATQRDPQVRLAPARGLTLIAVEYPPADQLAARAHVTRDRRSQDLSNS